MTAMGGNRRTGSGVICALRPYGAKVTHVPHATTSARFTRPAALTATVALLALIGAGCGGDPTVGAVAPTTPTIVAVVASIPTTLPPQTTTTIAETTTTLAVETTTTVAETTTTVAETTTTLAETTTAVADISTLVPDTAPPVTVGAAGLPTPVAPPADPYAAEKRVGLGTIEIPKIGVSKPMFEGVTLTTLDKGPGHWPGTAMPGQVGNVVVGGHRVSHDRPFRNIDKLVAGDQVIFTTDDGRFTYRVTGTEIVTPDAIRIIDQTPEATATLFACTPPGFTSHRIVIHLALSA